MRALRIMCLFMVVTLSGCVYALHGSEAPQKQTLRLQTAEPERYSVRVGEASTYPVDPDGVARFEIPELPRGCLVYVFGLKVADERPQSGRTIYLMRDKRIVRKLSLEQFAKIPRDDSGVPVLSLK